MIVRKGWRTWKIALQYLFHMCLAYLISCLQKLNWKTCLEYFPFMDYYNPLYFSIFFQQKAATRKLLRFQRSWLFCVWNWPYNGKTVKNNLLNDFWELWYSLWWSNQGWKTATEHQNFHQRSFQNLQSKYILNFLIKSLLTLLWIFHYNPPNVLIPSSA